MTSSNARLRIPVSEKDHSRGPKDAPLVMVEYGDYECPFCGRALGVIKRLQRALGRQLRLVSRHFPLTEIHPNAFRAARATEAAGRQGKFWEMHDRLLENQDQLEDEDLMFYAEDLGLEMDQFVGDLESDEVEEKILADQLGGVRSDVNGTPTYFINGSKYEGESTFEALLEALEAAAEQQKRSKVA
jgi:formate-nitrite transporter family protein